MPAQRADALARTTVVRALITIVAFDVVVAGFMVTSEYAKPNETFIAAGNLMLNGALAYAAYRRSSVARLVLGVLAGLSVLGIVALGWSARSTTMAMLIIAFGLIRLGAAGTLLASDNARQWTGAR